MKDSMQLWAADLYFSKRDPSSWIGATMDSRNSENSDSLFKPAAKNNKRRHRNQINNLLKKQAGSLSEVRLLILTNFYSHYLGGKPNAAGAFINFYRYVKSIESWNCQSIFENDRNDIDLLLTF